MGRGWFVGAIFIMSLATYAAAASITNVVSFISGTRKALVDLFLSHMQERNLKNDGSLV